VHELVRHQPLELGAQALATREVPHDCHRTRGGKKEACAEHVVEGATSVDETMADQHGKTASIKKWMNSLCIHIQSGPAIGAAFVSFSSSFIMYLT